MSVERDVPVQMPDGITLRVNVFGRLPWRRW